jgi:hypothetical protein
MSKQFDINWREECEVVDLQKRRGRSIRSLERFAHPDGKTYVRRPPAFVRNFDMFEDGQSH